MNCLKPFIPNAGKVKIIIIAIFAAVLVGAAGLGLCAYLVKKRRTEPQGDELYAFTFHHACLSLILKKTGFSLCPEKKFSRLKYKC